jgi:hypothetical protein
MAFEPAADGRDQRIRQAAFARHHLLARLVADHRLEIAHHLRIGMRPRHGADAIERVLDMGHPVAQRLVERILQRARPRLDGHHFGAQQLHAEDVGLLALDVDLAHEHDAFQPEAGTRRGGGDAVLAGAGLGDDPVLAHAAREQDLAHDVVDLVGARMVELVALEIDLGPAEVLGQPLGEIERRGPADIVLEERVELLAEGGIGLGRLVGLLQL